MQHLARLSGLLVLIFVSASACGRHEPSADQAAATAAASPAASRDHAGGGRQPGAGSRGHAAAGGTRSPDRAVQGRPRRHGEAPRHPRAHGAEPGPLLRGPRPRGRDDLRGHQGLREAPEQEARQQGRHASTSSRSRSRATSSSRACWPARATSRPPPSPSRPSARSRWTSRIRSPTGVREVLVSGPAAPAVGERRRPVGQGALRPAVEQLRRAPQDPEHAGFEGRQGRRSPSRRRRRSSRTATSSRWSNAGLVPATVVDDFMADLYVPGVSRS